MALKGACPNCGEEVSHCDKCHISTLFLFHPVPQLIFISVQLLRHNTYIWFNFSMRTELDSYFLGICICENGQEY